MEYLWLSIYVKLDYLTYINLSRAFNSVKEIYISSKDKDSFLKILRSNGIKISYTLYCKLVDLNLKNKAIQLYQTLRKKNIEVINIHSKYYPKDLKNIFNPPLVIFAYGDISLLLNKKVYMYNSNNFSITGEKIYNEYAKCMNDNNISIVEDKLTEYTNILFLPYMKNIDRGNLVVISDKIEKNSFINYEFIIGICNCLFIPEADYTIKVANIVDLMIEQGKDILVVPGSIYNKDAYFSNYLIRDGAICIISKLDLLQFLK